MNNAAIFKSIKFRNLEVKNRIFCSGISGRFDNEDGSGTQTPHQLGGKVRPRRRRRHHMLLCAGDAGRPDHLQPRYRAYGRIHPVLAAARRHGTSPGLQVHHCSSAIPAVSRTSPD
jgi:hypothetical protein